MAELECVSDADQDMALVELFRTGDCAAFDALFHRHKDGVYSLVYRILGPEAADDMAQEAFTQIYKALPRFRGDSAVKTWIYRITLNVCRDSLRRKMRSPSLVLTEAPNPVDEACDVTDETARLWEREELKRAIDTLSEAERAAVELHYFQGLSYAEMALVLNCPVGTIKARVHTAITTLRQKLNHLLAEVDEQ